MHTAVPQVESSQPSSLASPSSMSAQQTTLLRKPARRVARKPGRPPVYIFDKPEDQLTPEERKKKTAIIKRRDRQNRAYRRRREGRKKRPDDLANSQLAFDTTFTPPQSVQHPLPGVVPTPVNNPWPQDTPRVISGFAQNPLDLLASASGTDPNSSLTASTRASPFGAPQTLVDTSPGTRPETPSTSVQEPDRVSVHPVVNRSDQPSSLLQSSTDPMSTTTEQPVALEIDATTTPSLDISSLSFPFDKPKDQDERDPTDDLVSSALVAAQEYAKDSINLKDAMDQESDFLRMTGIKTIVFDNLRVKYISLDPTIQNALRHFVVFPRTFNLHAAASVAGLQPSQLVVMQGMLESMIQSNFINEVNGRYELKEPARLFLHEDETVFSDSLASNAYDVAQKRFVKHYQSQLSKLQDEQIHKVGWLREQAMALYDTERENMVYSEFLLDGKKAELREFLSAGITVMRYCVSASERERILQKALTDDETSTEEIFLPLQTDNPSEETSSSQSDEKREDCDKSHRARLQLALSEAYFDQLKTKDAEAPLYYALKLLGNQTPQRCEKSKHAGIVDSVLVLLLLSNLHLGENKIPDARKLCIQALNILKHATLGRSTFGINAMSNLVTIYLREGQLGKAKSVAGRLLDILNTMRYTGMPIYADALGVCAMVSMAEGNYSEAERQYLTALDTVGRWESKDWTGVPVQHCLDLDVWLMEGCAEAIRLQGRVEDARRLEQRAAAARESRGLSPCENGTEDYLDVSTEEDSGRPGQGHVSRQTLRHLY